jgi:hypothetical protein
MSSLCFARRIQASPKARAASFILRMPLLLCPTILGSEASDVSGTTEGSHPSGARCEVYLGDEH